jgi:hypothetical protein
MTLFDRGTGGGASGLMQQTVGKLLPPDLCGWYTLQ